MASIVKDGKTLKSNTRWLNKRTTKNEEFLSFQKRRGVYQVSSNILGRRWEFNTKAELDDFFEKTFGGWHSDIMLARREHERQLVVAAAYDEAIVTNDLIDSIVAAGIATYSEAIERIIGLANQTAKIAYDRGHSEGYETGYDSGRESGYDQGYGHGWDNHGDDSADMYAVHG